ncbi:uncharacterized protein [Amphiura filiformis]|uniref:uncharacterized protein n=1 Tax=Amphiura filiformis TaxID=82378 RepID=UPI003B217BC1
MASVGIEKTEQQNTDEITNYVSSRWITASTATWSMFEFPTHGRHPPIVRLAVHEENQQTVIFKEGEEDIALDRNTNTTLTAWMKFNEDHPEARQHTYDQFPVHYRWDAANKRWLPRKTSNYCIARVYSTNPAQGERHYLRMLLHHIPGATCYNDLKTVHGTTYPSYKQTAIVMGLLDDDAEWERCLNESVLQDMPCKIRRLFAIILVYCAPANPAHLWNTFNEHMSDDLARPHLTPSQITNQVLLSLDTLLKGMNSSLQDFPDIPPGLHSSVPNFSCQ